MAVDLPTGNIVVAGNTTGSVGGTRNLGGVDALMAGYSSDGDLLWTRQFGTNGVDKLFGAATDSANRAVAISGLASAPIAGAIGSSNKGKTDPLVGKYSFAGDRLWLNQQLGGPTDDFSTAVTTDSDGNVFATGWTEGPICTAQALGSLCAVTSHGYRDVWLAKYASTGELLWVRQFGADTVNGVPVCPPGGKCPGALDAAYGLATDSAGNIYVGGISRGDLFGPVKDTDHGEVYGDAFVAKFDTSGNFVWGKQFGTNAVEVVFGVATDSFGDVVVTGRVDGPLFINPRVGLLDIFVVKLQGSNGTQLWARQFGSTKSELGTGIAVDINDNVLVGAATNGSIAAYNPPGHGRDFLIRKYDRNGNEISTRQIGSSAADYLMDITADEEGNVIVCGRAEGAFPGQSHGGAQDAVVVKYAP